MSRRVPKVDSNTVVSATSLRNYVRDNGISDWLQFHGEKYGYRLNRFSPFTRHNMKKGINYELKELARIKGKLDPKDFIQICKEMPNDVYKLEYIRKTESAMIQGIPVIYQGSIYNKLEGFIGAPDFIIRADYMKKLFDVHPPKIRVSYGNLLPHNYLYYIVDIKSKDIKTLKSGLVSDSVGFVHYKTQVTVYNMCLKTTQGIYPTEAYISTPSGVGSIKLSEEDEFYYGFVTSAKNCLLHMKKTGAKWDPLNLDGIPKKFWHAMIPNLKIYDDITQEAKLSIALKTNSLSLLPWCGQDKVEKSMKQGVVSYMDPRCTADFLGFTKSRAEIVDGIIDINRGDTLIKYNKLIESSRPQEFFFDTEYIHHTSMEDSDFHGTLVYHIGIAWMDKKRRMFKSFIVNSLTEDEEERIFNEFNEFMSNASADAVVYHWSNAENVQIKRINDKYGINMKMNLVDLCQKCKNQKLFVKSCFSYGLKELATKLYEYKKIKSTWDIMCADRIDTFGACIANIANINEQAMRLNTHIPNIPEYIAIENYNKIDCYVMLEILNLLYN